MDLWQTLVLAVVQGLTEFLPISSAAHLILVPVLTQWPDQGLAFDVAVHAGTLAAVLVYFRSELAALFQGWLRSITEREHSAESRLAWGVLLGTAPAGLAGLLFSDIVQTTLRSPMVIAAATIGFGLLLWWADARGRRARGIDRIGLADAMAIGLAQAIALVPGTSRSGITITAGLMLGLTRQAAARFSFLLSIPVIALATGFEAVEVARGHASVSLSQLAIGAVAAGVSAYLCIEVFLRLLDRIGMLPFVIYRLVLGAILL